MWAVDWALARRRQVGLDQYRAHLPAAQKQFNLQLQSAPAHLSKVWAECQSATGLRTTAGLALRTDMAQDVRGDGGAAC